MSIDPDKHCIRTVGSINVACDVAELQKKRKRDTIVIRKYENKIHDQEH